MAANWRTDVLHRISSFTHAKLATYSSRMHSAQPPSIGMPPSTNLILPTPPSIAPQLIRLGVETSSAARIASALTRVTSRIKENFELDHRHRCQSDATKTQCLRDPRLSSALTIAYNKIYLKAIRDWTSYLLDDVTPRVLVAQRVLSDRTSLQANKRPFNHKAIPMLEKVFVNNAFPTRLEKLELASKCDMDYRQIHVWFQNRRSRSRKEGKELKKSERSGSLSDELEAAVVNELLPSEPDDTEDETLSVFDTSVGALLSTSILTPEAPLHAFPAPYPPLCSYEPFPTTPAKRALALPWIRLAGRENIPDRTDVDVEDLIKSLARLSIGDNEQPDVVRSARCRSSGLPLPWTFITPCARAPHPALVRRNKRGSRASLYRSSCAVERTDSPPTRCIQGNGLCAVSFDEQVSNPSILATAKFHAPARIRHTLPRRVPKHPPCRPIPTTRTPSNGTFTNPTSSVNHSTRSASRSTSGSDTDSPLPTPTGSPVHRSVAIPSVPGVQGLQTHKPSDLSLLESSMALPGMGIDGVNLYDLLPFTVPFIFQDTT